jgi:hypothetical protein
MSPRAFFATKRSTLFAVAAAASVLLTGGAAQAISSRTLFTPTGEASGDALGASVACVGGVNGDGYADVIVGASGNSAGGVSAGRAYVCFVG